LMRSRVRLGSEDVHWQCRLASRARHRLVHRSPGHDSLDARDPSPSFDVIGPLLTLFQTDDAVRHSALA
jgi:hypothetical protein